MTILTAQALFDALSDLTRLRTLRLLDEMELSVGELAMVFGFSQPRMSRHVKHLADVGLINRRGEGGYVFLSLDDGAWLDPFRGLIADCASTAEQDQFRADLERLELVRVERAQAAARYFATHAASWDQIRSLYVEESEVEAAIARALGDAPIGLLVDVGTGTGRMLELFASRCKQAIGIDRSSEMLRLARVKLDEAGVRNAQLAQGDMFALPLDADGADVVLLHQVLHFASNPTIAIAEAARVLADDGRLLIIDFDAHDRDDLRARNAHVRLGFADAAMRGWFEEAGLEFDQVVRLEGGELTVMLWSGRKVAQERIVA